MKCKRGDVVLVRFANSDRITYKKRPALIIQSDRLITGIPQILIAMVTSTLWTGSSRVLIRQSSNEGRSMGINRDSVVMTDNIITVLIKDIDKVIGHCPIMSIVDQALRSALDL